MVVIKNTTIFQTWGQMPLQRMHNIIHNSYFTYIKPIQAYAAHVYTMGGGNFDLPLTGRCAILTKSYVFPLSSLTSTTKLCPCLKILKLISGSAVCCTMNGAVVDQPESRLHQAYACGSGKAQATVLSSEQKNNLTGDHTLIDVGYDAGTRPLPAYYALVSVREFRVTFIPTDHVRSTAWISHAENMSLQSPINIVERARAHDVQSYTLTIEIIIVGQLIHFFLIHHAVLRLIFTCTISCKRQCLLATTALLSTNPNNHFLSPQRFAMPLHPQIPHRL